LVGRKDNVTWIYLFFCFWRSVFLQYVGELCRIGVLSVEVFCLCWRLANHIVAKCSACYCSRCFWLALLLWIL